MKIKMLIIKLITLSTTVLLILLIAQTVISETTFCTINLKSGGRLKGYLIAEDNDSIKIKSDGVAVTLLKKNIERLERKQITEPDPKLSNSFIQGQSNSRLVKKYTFTGQASKGDEKTITEKKQENSSGTAFFISHKGHLVTNNHVINDCKNIRIYNSKIDSTADVIYADKHNDLAIIKSKKSYLKYALLRGGEESRLGEDIITVGYPMGALLGDTIKVTRGSISSVTGIANNKSIMQISAPVQPGSSGGPVLDMSGNVVGVVSSKLNELQVAKETGSFPQNINFAIKSSTLRKFLDAHGIYYVVKYFTIKRETADLVETAKDYTVRVLCYE